MSSITFRADAFNVRARVAHLITVYGYTLTIERVDGFTFYVLVKVG